MVPSLCGMFCKTKKKRGGVSKKPPLSPRLVAVHNKKGNHHKDFVNPVPRTIRFFVMGHK